MIAGRSVLGVIVARGGSKGFPRKNIAPLRGKPLLAWTVEAARNSRYLDRLILSSDDAEIIEVAESLGCEVPFVRPAHLATDSASLRDVLFHALEVLGENYDYLVLLQATSPLRQGGDIDRCLEICVESAAPACVSLTEPEKSPYIMYRVDEEGAMEPLFPDLSLIGRRQELPPVYVPNGAVYVAETNWFRRTGTFYSRETHAYLMPRSRSVDVDYPTDLIVASAALDSGLLQ